ncbi:MAG: efflux RND transporter periplasmic adaptor subunit [Bacteroidota bacterium]
MQKLLILFSISIIAITSCNLGKKETVTEEATAETGVIKLTDEQMKYIKKDTVKLVNDQDLLILNGKISFDQNIVTKIYPYSGGTVIKVTAGIGDFVRKGQTLAIIKGGDVSTVQNNYAEAKVALDLAKKNADAAKELYKTNVYSERDMISADNDYKKALAELAKAKSYLDMMGMKEESVDATYTISSPTDGFVVERNVSENTAVRPDNSNNLFTISNLKTVWVLADLYENDISKIIVGDSVEIKTIAYPDKEFKGKVDQIGSFLDPQSRVVKVRVVLDNSEKLLKPEMYASVRISTIFPGKVLAVPTKALVLTGDNYVVMVAGPNKRFIKHPVTILRSLESVTLIKSGLKEGDEIVTDGSLLVSNNNAAK